MLNKIFKYLAILLILPNLNCAAVTVFDPQNLAKSVEILKAAKSQFEQMKRVHAELSSAKKLLGDFSEDAQNKIAELTNWRNYYDYIDLLDVDQISAANFLGVDGKLPLNNTLDTFNAIQTKLFNKRIARPNDLERIKIVPNIVCISPKQCSAFIQSSKLSGRSDRCKIACVVATSVGEDSDICALVIEVRLRSLVVN